MDNLNFIECLKRHKALISIIILVIVTASSIIGYMNFPKDLSVIVAKASASQIEDGYNKWKKQQNIQLDDSLLKQSIQYERFGKITFELTGRIAQEINSAGAIFSKALTNEISSIYQLRDSNNNEITELKLNINNKNNTTKNITFYKNNKKTFFRPEKVATFTTPSDNKEPLNSYEITIMYIDDDNNSVAKIENNTITPIGKGTVNLCVIKDGLLFTYPIVVR